jgi:hypothetical protein
MTTIQPADTLIELCTLMRKLSVGKTTEEVFDTLQALVGNDIKIRYEIIRETTSEKKEKENDTSSDNKGRFTHLNGLKIARVLLTSNRLKADFSRELVRICNGVVLEYPTWNVLSVPAMMFNPRFRVADVINDMDSYSIYEIKDGTTVTLYHYNDTWCLSSTNGFDVREYQWMGPSTYIQCLNAVSKMYPDFSYEKLDKKCAYTIGFRHNEFHPLMRDHAKMWLIQSCDVSALNSATPSLNIGNVNIGLPLQTCVTFTNLTGKQLFKHMHDRNASALDKYLNTSRAVAQPDIHYGYVLRHNRGGANSNIILESELLRHVRFLMYNLPKRKFNEAVPVTAQNRLEYTILRAYLSFSAKYMFLNLFPQFSEKYREYDALFSKLSNKIISALRNRNAREALLTTKSNKDQMTMRIDKLAFVLAKHIDETSRINAMDSQGANIVLDFIMDRKHLDLYYSCLFSPMP